MALLLDRRALGRGADGIISADLSEKMAAVQAAQRFPEAEGFDLPGSRAWLNEYGRLSSAGFEIEIEFSDQQLPTTNGPVPVRIYNPGAIL